MPTQCIYVFCVDLRTNSDYFLYIINWLVWITETECVYCAYGLSVYISFKLIFFKWSVNNELMCVKWHSPVSTCTLAFVRSDWGRAQNSDKTATHCARPPVFVFLSVWRRNTKKKTLFRGFPVSEPPLLQHSESFWVIRRQRAVCSLLYQRQARFETDRQTDRQCVWFMSVLSVSVLPAPTFTDFSVIC